MVLIALRCWHLAVIQYDDRVEESRRPQQRAVYEPAKRATIRDRFNIPLAVNKVQYQAAIQYGALQQVPAVVWTIDPETGKKKRTFKRREYIQELAQLLGEELNLDPERLVDLIHSKASLYGHIPYVIKDDISEREYYRLKMLEKDWYGIHVRRFPKRYYPKGKVGADVIGFMGAINRDEYESVIQEIKTLKQYLAQLEEGENPDLPEGMKSAVQARNRLQDLQEMAYGINDYVGKSGVEGYFDQDLRGFQGKKTYFSDARGNFLKELPGSRDPLPGQRLLLTISSELQQFAEELLIKNEKIRKSRVSGLKAGITLKEPWIKGGAIVAMDPNTGELLALASYPRFDPNDFVASGNPQDNKLKQDNILRWFETEDFVGQVWDQKRPLQRETYDKKYEVHEEDVIMNWETYLDFILPSTSPVTAAFKKFDKLESVVEVQRIVQELQALTGKENIYVLFNSLYKGAMHQPYGGKMGAVVRERVEDLIKKNKLRITQLQNRLNEYIGSIPANYDKVLFVDLCALIASSDFFSQELLKKTGKQRLSSYKNAAAAMAIVSTEVKEMSRDLFHQINFKEWREQNEKAYLKEMRAEEKLNKQYARPYIDYLDKKEKELFKEFWLRHRWQLLTTFLIGDWIESHPDEKLQPYIDYFLVWFKELVSGAHTGMPWSSSYHHLRSVLRGFDLDIAMEYLQTLRSFRDLDKPLLGKYQHLRKENGVSLQRHLAAAFYPCYGYGFARSHCYRHAATLGSIFKVVTAYQALVQRYNEMDDPHINSSDLNPLLIIDQFHKEGKEEFVGYHMNGKSIPRYYKGGRMPRSLSKNLGKLDIVGAMEHSSNIYFALLAGDVFHEPDDLKRAAELFSYGSKTGVELPSEISGKVPDDLMENRSGLYSLSIGQHSLVATPLQTAVMLSAIANGGKVLQPKIVHLKVGRPPIRVNLDDLAENSEAYENCFVKNDQNDTSHGAQSLIKKCTTVVVRDVFMPDQVRRILLEGLNRVVQRSQQLAIGSMQNLYRQYPEAVRDFIDLKGQLVGKTSTGESVENIDLDLEIGTNKYNHLWFGGISFDSNSEGPDTFVFKDKYGKPELVVVVYLRFGAYGKDTTPVAAQVIKKWRAIKKNHAKLMDSL